MKKQKDRVKIKKIKENMTSFIRTFVMTVMLISLPAVLIGGMVVADNEARQTMAGDQEKAFWVETEDNALKIDFFGQSFVIDLTPLYNVRNMLNWLIPLLPGELRLGISLIAKLVGFLS